MYYSILHKGVTMTKDIKKLQSETVAIMMDELKHAVASELENQETNVEEDAKKLKETLESLNDKNEGAST